MVKENHSDARNPAGGPVPEFPDEAVEDGRCGYGVRAAANKQDGHGSTYPDRHSRNEPGAGGSDVTVRSD